MRRGPEQRVRRVLLGVAALASALALTGCGMTPRDQFFSARAITFGASPGQPGSVPSGLAAGNSSSGLAAAFGGTR